MEERHYEHIQNTVIASDLDSKQGKSIQWFSLRFLMLMDTNTIRFCSPHSQKDEKEAQGYHDS